MDIYKSSITLMYQKNYQCYLKPSKFFTSFKPHHPLRSFMSGFKYTYPRSKLKGVIYKILYRDWNFDYIGETSRSLDSRLKEREYLLRKGTSLKIVIHALEKLLVTLKGPMLVYIFLHSWYYFHKFTHSKFIS